MTNHKEYSQQLSKEVQLFHTNGSLPRERVLDQTPIEPQLTHNRHSKLSRSQTIFFSRQVVEVLQKFPKQRQKTTTKN